MLAELKIENVAVIEKAEVQFTPGLNVLTGETGAGKSIMIDSINAILGNRTSRDLVRSGAPKARIWATFESIPAHVREQVEKCGYGAQDDLLLYREISADGKGSCRINGMPATAGVVRDISAGLLTIHGQHDSTSLTNPGNPSGPAGSVRAGWGRVCRLPCAVPRSCHSKARAGCVDFQRGRKAAPDRRAFGRD